MSALNEILIRDVVAEVMGKLGGTSTMTSQPAKTAPTPKADACSCSTKPVSSTTVGLRGKFGVFQDANEACSAAQEAYLLLQKKGVAARRKIEEIVKTMAEKNAEPWGKIEFEETRIGRLDHKIAKLQIIKLVPGVDWLRPDGRSGDHGITLEEYTPFGVVGAVTPSTHSIPTLSGNIVNIVAAGNAVVFNAHPSAARCAAMAVRAYNEAIYRETGIENITCIIEKPTLDSFSALCKSEHIRLLLVTGGPAVVKAAMQSGKRAICAGPGNPPVFVDDTCCSTRAARAIIEGAAFDNNLLCIGEKEVFVLENTVDKLMQKMSENGAVKLNSTQLSQLTKAAFIFKEGQGGGCAHASVNRDFIGKVSSIAPIIGPGKFGARGPSNFTDIDVAEVVVELSAPMPLIVGMKVDVYFRHNDL